MSTTTTNMGLTKPDLSDSADIRVLNGNMDKLDTHRHGGGTDGLSVRAVQAGTLSNRPAYGNAGQLYVATDVPAMYFDTGGAWVEVGQGGGGGEVWLHTTSNTTPNGSTTAFTIGAGVNATKVRVYVNGILRRPGGVDYTHVSGENHVDFAWAPLTGDDVRMDYVAV